MTLHPLISTLALWAVEDNIDPALVEFEFRKRFLELVMEVEGSQAAVARRLGLHRNSLALQLVRYGVKR